MPRSQKRGIVSSGIQTSRGLGSRSPQPGGKTYIFQYKIARPGEAERTAAKRYTIGKHGKLTPDQTRKRAKELAALVAQGIDPRQRDLDAIAAEDKARKLAEERAALEGELAFENCSPSALMAQIRG